MKEAPSHVCTPQLNEWCLNGQQEEGSGVPSGWIIAGNWIPAGWQLESLLLGAAIVSGLFWNKSFLISDRSISD